MGSLKHRDPDGPSFLLRQSCSPTLAKVCMPRERERERQRQRERESSADLLFIKGHRRLHGLLLIVPVVSLMVMQTVVQTTENTLLLRVYAYLMSDNPERDDLNLKVEDLKPAMTRLGDRAGITALRMATFCREAALVPKVVSDGSSSSGESASGPIGSDCFSSFAVPLSLSVSLSLSLSVSPSVSLSPSLSLSLSIPPSVNHRQLIVMSTAADEERGL